MKTLLALLLTICCSLATHAQSGIQRFLVSEYRVDSPQVGNYAYLTAYNFKNGKFIGKDTLLQQPKSKEEDKAFRVVYNSADHIYKKRYLLTKYGGSVIDLKARKRIHKTEDTFIEAFGDSLVYQSFNAIRGQGYWLLNLITGTYTKIEPNSWYTRWPATTSPDKRYFLSVNRSATPYKLVLNDFNGNSKVLVKDAKSGALSKNMTQFPSIESHWLNNNEFLYVVHHRVVPRPDVLYHKVEFRKYNLKDSSDRLQYTLDSIPQGFRNGYFYRTEIGEIYYIAASGQSFLLDTIKLTLSALKERRQTHNFSVIHSKEGTLFKYKGEAAEIKNIGEYRIAAGIVGARFGGYIGDPKGYLGVMFWSATTKKWLSFDIPWIDAIIGWWEE